MPWIILGIGGIVGAFFASAAAKKQDRSLADIPGDIADAAKNIAILIVVVAIIYLLVMFRPRS